MESKLIIIRHGKTSWNHERRYQGQTDIKLNDEGIKQAYKLKQRLENEKITAIYSSDLIRAQETAAIIAKPHNLKVQINKEFREMHFGDWEGLTFNEVEKKYPTQAQAWLLKPHELKIENGESFILVRDRALKELKNVFQLYPQGNIILVGHGGVNAALICGLLGKPLADIWNYMQKNTAITTLERKEGKINLSLSNDYSHLDE